MMSVLIFVALVALVWSDFYKHIKLNKIIMNQDDVIVELDGLKQQAVKVGKEVTGLGTKITELETLIKTGAVKPELEAKLAEVKAAWQVVDDMTPDKPTPTPEQPPV